MKLQYFPLFELISIRSSFLMFKITDLLLNQLDSTLKECYPWDMSTSLKPCGSIEVSFLLSTIMEMLLLFIPKMNGLLIRVILSFLS